jgi:hypothetical protein
VAHRAVRAFEYCIVGNDISTNRSS